MGMYASLSKGDLIEMNNKKLSRLLEPNLKLYFLCMIVFAAATATVSLPLGLVEIACTVGLYAYFTNRNQKRRQNILQYIDNVTGSVDTASKSTLINSPLPIMVFRPDTGEVIWSNENFLQLAGVREHLFEMKVEDAVPDFPVQWMLEGKQECPDRVVMNSRRFRVYGSLVRAKGRGAEQNLVATTYWVDTTEADDLRERYTATRPVLAILMVDNYEDLMKACADTQRSAVLAQIDEKLNNWAACADGLLLKTERDHYLFIFEECHYDHFVEEKFSILDAIREIKVGDVCPTLSIGIGKDADAMAELYREDIAVAAIDQEGVDRVTAAQAADELLSLKGVKASFVVFPSGENVQMSARSLGEVNVQVILEALGGGGNSTTAGGRVENTDVETVKSRLLEAIDAYFEK